MSYNSKYSGQQVENLLDQVANGNVGGGGGITQETDPIFSASPSAGITNENISSWNDKADKVEVANHGIGDTTFTLTPNVYHKWGEVTSLSLTLATPSDDTVYNEYMFEFVSGSTATTLTLPDTIKWVSTPDIKENMIYQCSVVNSIGIFVAVSSFISFTILGNYYVASDGMTWEQWCNSDYNTNGITIRNGMVFYGGSSYVSSEDGFVLPTDEIKENYAYGTASNEPV